MENKIHWRKITSNTSIKEKSDGQKADTWESIVLVTCRLMVIAPPHLQNPLSEMFLSHTRGVTAPAQLRQAPRQQGGCRDSSAGECLKPGTGLRGRRRWVVSWSSLQPGLGHSMCRVNGRPTNLWI